MKTLVTADGEIVNAETFETIPEDGPFWKTPYNHDRDAEALSTALECKDPSKTQQQFAKEADINVILAKFLNTGELPLTGEAIYQDAKDLFDLQDNIVTSYMVEQAWNELPLAARNILKDPKIFLDYVDHCMKTGDLDPLRELGLAKPEPPKPGDTPGGVAPAPPPPAGAPSAPTTPPTGAKTGP